MLISCGEKHTTTPDIPKSDSVFPFLKVGNELAYSITKPSAADTMVINIVSETEDNYSKNYMDENGHILFGYYLSDTSLYTSILTNFTIPIIYWNCQVGSKLGISERFEVVSMSENVKTDIGNYDCIKLAHNSSEGTLWFSKKYGIIKYATKTMSMTLVSKEISEPINSDTPFPFLKVGSKWKYAVKKQSVITTNTTVNIVGITEDGNTKKYLNKDGEVLFLCDLTDTSLSAPILLGYTSPIMYWNCQVGKKWGITERFEISSIHTEITTPIGSYDCIVLSFNEDKGTLWFSKKYGLIQYITDTMSIFLTSKNF